jgi:hypothetical protein
MSNAAQKLTQFANDARKNNIVKNVYNGEADANEYSATHTRALKDQETPVQGKGTGIYLDTYNGGGELDILGSPNYGGSGRLAAIAYNQSQWGMSPNNPYTAPQL